MITTRSQELFAEALRYIPGGVNSPVRAFRAVGGNPFFAQRAYGSRVEDVDGNSYIDYVCTWGPSILGHARPEVIAAIKAAAELGTSFGIPNPLEVELARKICAWVPSVDKVRMTNSGTEATMTAIRLARGFTRRDKIIKFEGCYHGHVDSLLVKAGSGALTLGQPDSAGIPAALAALTLALPFNDADALRSAFAQNKGEIAAVIVEPIPANAGLILPQPGYLETMRQLCTENGTLLIFDEVMTGFRVALGGAQALYAVRPDLTTLGKIIGGGMPVGAFGGRRDIMERLAPLGPIYQAGTLSGNPVAMIAGLTTLEILSAPRFHARLNAATAELTQRLAESAASAGIPLSTNQVCGMFGFFFTSEKAVDRYSAVMACDVERFKRFFHGMLDEGIYLAPSAFEAGFMSAAHTSADIDATIAAASRVFARLKRTESA